MERLIVTPRPHWQRRCEHVGFHFHTLEGPYWDEGVCYRFTPQEIDELEAATHDLHQLCLELVDQVIRRDLFAPLGISAEYQALCTHSWEQQEPSLYGRFDLIYDGVHPPKMLEYNADTPTSLLEASVVQWLWLEDTHPTADQFNSIHEQLLATFHGLDLSPDTLYFASVSESPEDLGTVEYLRDVAIQAGFQTQHLYIDQLGWQSETQEFVDLNNHPIRTLFKLYPWEWLIQEEFGPLLAQAQLRLIEPAWKMILSNKGILPLLWELFPGHPQLLPAAFEPLDLPYVQKPLFSREGANIRLVTQQGAYQTSGPYGQGGFVYQKYQAPPNFDGHYPVIGSWIIGNQPAGMGIREDHNPVTSNTSRFIPHFF